MVTPNSDSGKFLNHNRSTLNELMADISRKDVERLVKRRSPIKEVNITALNLDKLNFEGAIFTKCKFTGSTFNGSDFAFSPVSYTHLRAHET